MLLKDFNLGKNF